MLTPPAVAQPVERALTIETREADLVAVLHDVPAPSGVGVVIVVGGPQYRVGSHRSLVALARELAAAGVPVLRFDHCGIGDSDGDVPDFERLDTDVRTAVDTLCAHCPTVREVALWGLCDAVPAILFYAPQDPRVTRIAVLNPWVRTEAGEARAVLRHYYLWRLASPDFWRRLLGGTLDIRAALKGLLDVLRRSRSPGGAGATTAASAAPVMAAAPLPDRMAAALARFRGDVLLVTSERDLVAQEFKDTVTRSRAWRRALRRPGTTWHQLAEADHTFSRREWLDQVVAWTRDWLLAPAGAGR